MSSIVFEKLRFQNVLRPHKNETPAFSNSSGLNSVFEKLRFRDGLVWTVGLTVEIKLSFQTSPAGSKLLITLTFKRLSKLISKSRRENCLRYFLKSFCWFSCAEEGEDMFKDLSRTCTAIVPLIKIFVWWRSRCVVRRGFA